MFLSKSPAEKSGLDKAIDMLFAEMQGFTADTDEYTSMVAHMDTLYKLKEIDKPERVSRDTLAIVAGNLVAAAMILGYERANVVTSKALSFMLKTR